MWRGRQSLKGPCRAGADALLQQFPVSSLVPAIVLTVPEVQHPGRERTFLAANTGIEHSHRQVGVFETPAFKRFVEAADAVKVGSLDSEIAGAHALPAVGRQLPHRTERQRSQRKRAIDFSALLCRAPFCHRPGMQR